MTTISTQQILKNIYDIAEKNGIMLKDVENAAGVSIGYFSKIIKQGSETKLSIDTLIGLSELFDMTVDNIINYHNRREFLRSDDVRNFIVNLKEDTQSRKLGWQIANEDYVKDTFIKSYGYANYKLQKEKGYCAALNEKCRIYFFKVRYTQNLGDRIGASSYGFELYMADGNAVYPVSLSMNVVNFEAFSLFAELEKKIQENVKEVQVDEHVKDMILNYMSERKSKKNDK